MKGQEGHERMLSEEQPVASKRCERCAEHLNMEAWRQRKYALVEDQRGITLAEVLITIVIAGIVFAIATSSWFGLIERREVGSATSQIVADLRLSHSSATNRLAPAKVIFNNHGNAVTCGAGSADYCLVQPTATGSRFLARNLPGQVRLSSPNVVADITGGPTSTLEFAADSSARTLRPLGTVSTDDCPATTPLGVPRLKISSADNEPRRCVTFDMTTSRTRID